VLSPHHEDWSGHDPDEDWELWSAHVVNEIGACHWHEWDAFYRFPAFHWRGFWQNGYVDRVDGTHYDGSY
jgi:hypothetical protein